MDLNLQGNKPLNNGLKNQNYEVCSEYYIIFKFCAYFLG